MDEASLRAERMNRSMDEVDDAMVARHMTTMNPIAGELPPVV